MFGPERCDSCAGTTAAHAPDCPWNPYNQPRAPRSSSSCGCILLAAAALFAVISGGFALLKDYVTGERVRLTAQETAALKKHAGSWNGTYICDGKTRGMKLRITVADPDAGDVRAEFFFYRTRAVSGEPLGIAGLKGIYRAGGFDLQPHAWIVHPDGYRMIDLRSTSIKGDPPVMRGELDRTARRCTTFTVTKQ